MVNTKNLYWLAGIVDGEGYLTTNKRNGVHRKTNKGRGHYSFITRIGVGNTDIEMIKKISEIFVGLGAKFYYTLHNPPKNRPDSMQYISINVEGYKSCKKILEAIVNKSNSFQKKKQMELMLEYINYRLSLLQDRDQYGRLSSKVKYEKFIAIDTKFVNELQEYKRYQVSPSTTIRKASTVLQW